MFITIQFPIVDYRYLQDDPLKLAKPQWPEPNPDNEKMLYFGRIFNRNIPYNGPWDDEKRYCNVKKVISFNGMGEKQFHKSIQISWDTKILFRRFQSDGKFLAKFEIGLYDSFESSLTNGLKGQALKDSIYNHINNYLLCPVSIKIGSKYSEFTSLIHAGEKLSNAYFWSTCKPGTKRNFDSKIPGNYVDAGEPTVIVQLDTNKFDIACLDSGKVELEQLKGQEINLFHDNIIHSYKGNRNFLKTWFIATPENKKTLPINGNAFNNYESIIRYLRINLLRIHVEKVVLKKVGQKIGKSEAGFNLSNADTEKRVLLHLHKILFNLSKDSRNSQQQGKLVEMAFMLEEVSNNTELEQQIIGLKATISFLEKLSDRNKPIINYTKQIIQNMGDQISIGTINGNFINKAHLVNSLNNSGSNGLDEETKQTLLAIAKKIEESQNINAAAIFDKFNEELAKPAPEQNKSKLKQFWDGLVKVMPDIATIGKSIAGIVALF